ncbi:MAG: hypothetical protein K2N89_01310, partial [Lachnospiraceae bacterium]|nr:hypothetical protein [Lachnospiraceae bacterium]
MKKLWYLFILLLILLTGCHDTSNEKSYFEIETELTTLLESQNPYEDEFIQGVHIMQKSDADRNASDGDDLAVYLHCYNDTYIGQDFILVRDTVLDYSINNNCKFSSLMINTKKSETENAFWLSYDLETGIYCDKIHENTLNDITLEKLANLNISSSTDNATETIENLNGRGT